MQDNIRSDESVFRVGEHYLPAALVAMLSQTAGPGAQEIRVISSALAGGAEWLSLRTVTWFSLAQVGPATIDWRWRARGDLANGLKLHTRFSARGRRHARVEPGWLDMDRAVIVGFAGPEERDQVIALDYAASHRDPAVRVSRVGRVWGSYDHWHEVAGSFSYFEAGLVCPVDALEQCWAGLSPSEKALLAAVALDGTTGPIRLPGATLRERFDRLVSDRLRGAHEDYESICARLVTGGLLNPTVDGGVDPHRYPQPWRARLHRLCTAWAASLGDTVSRQRNAGNLQLVR